MSKQEELLADLLEKIVGKNERDIIETLQQKNDNIIELDDNYREKFIEQTLLSVYNEKLPRGFFKFKCAEDPFVKKVTELKSSKNIIGLLTDEFINTVEDGTLKELLGCLKNINKKDQVASKKSEKLNTIKISFKEKNIDKYDLSSSVVGGVCELLDYIHADYKDDYLPTKIQNYIEKSNQYNDREKHFFKMLINALINSKHNQTEFIKAVGYDQKKTPHIDWGIPEDFWNAIYINLKNKEQKWWQVKIDPKQVRKITYENLTYLKNGKNVLPLITITVNSFKDYLSAKERNLFKKMLDALNKVSDEKFKSAKHYIPINVFADDGSINESYFDKIYENLNDKKKRTGKWWKTDEDEKKMKEKQKKIEEEEKRKQEEEDRKKEIENDSFSFAPIAYRVFIFSWEMSKNAGSLYNIMNKYKTENLNYWNNKEKDFIEKLIKVLKKEDESGANKEEILKNVKLDIDANKIDDQYCEKLYENLKKNKEKWWVVD